MPYVDQGEPKEFKMPPLGGVLPYVALIAAVGISVFLYWFCYEKMGLNQWLPELLTGPVIGTALRLSIQRPGQVPAAGRLTVMVSILTCLTAYALRHLFWINWLDPSFQPDLAHAFTYLFASDMVSLLIMAFGCYLGYAMVLPKTLAPPTRHTQ